jgi:alpha-L-arabinofuranosidase
MDGLITAHWAAMSEIDRRHRVKLVVDEWGAWHKSGTEMNPAHLFGQQSTMRDALLAALTFDTFHRHADKVVMANVAQLVNCLHSLFLADGDRFVVTPTFHVFETYAAHVGGHSVRMLISAPSVGYERVGSKGSLWGLAGSASVKNRTLTLTVVNPHVSDARETEIAVRGATPSSARITTLASTDIHAHNTFDQPDAVRTREEAAGPARSGVLTCRIPAASVSRISIELA